MGPYPICHNGRTAVFKLDWHPIKLGTFFMLFLRVLHQVMRLVALVAFVLRG